MIENSATLAVVGAVRYSSLQPAFALPVLSRSNDGRLWIQLRDSRSQRIVGFIPLAETRLEDIAHQTHIPVEIGSDYVHAFIDRQGQLFIDTAAGLRTNLSIAYNHPVTPLCTKIAIAEQLSLTRADQLELQGRLADGFDDEFGKSSSRSYKNSFVRQRYWDLLEAAASSTEAASRIVRSKAQLRARVLADGTLDLDSSALDPQDLRVPIDTIEAQLGAEFGHLVISYGPPPKLDLSDLRFAHNPSSAVILRAVQSSPRQEERLAVLMRAALIHPDAGAEAIQRHHDRGAFARDALQLLRGRLGRQLNDHEREVAVATTVHEIYLNCYPFGRGKFLYYISTHLNDFPLIKGIVERILGSTSAEAVEAYRPEILAALNGKGVDPLRR
jgi:hypothetical protein